MFSRIPKIIDKPFLWVMGGPGSGKKSFANNFPSCEHISMGDCLRKFVYSNHPKSAIVKAEMDDGLLLPDEFIRQILVAQPAMHSTKPVLMSGYPRTVSQLEQSKKMFNAPIAVINLSVSRETMYERLIRRGRAEDRPEIIDFRIEHYFKSIQPLALTILRESSCSINIQADQLTPKEVTEIGIEFLEPLGITPEHYNPTEARGKSRYRPTCFD